MYLEWKLGSSLWQKIDWAAGTSTGGIITLGLARKHSLEDVLKLYLRLKNEIFVGRRPYSAKDFESLLKQELGNDTMSSVVSPKLVITSCLTHVAPPKLKLFRNYVPAARKIGDNERKKLGYDDPSHVLLWKAARCSSAAPTYFPPFEEIYSDGGIIANNPTVELLTEFFRYKNIAAQKTILSLKTLVVLFQ
uniref:PNPLA domain-containing protein n=1 Tax=Ditylenchus dipsaci TaxID=166011 RepID=A0A915DK97_9BILA